MEKKKNYLHYLIRYFIIMSLVSQSLLSLTGCSSTKKTTEPEQGSLELYPINTEVLPYEIATINYIGELNETQYSGYLGSEEIVIAVDPVSMLVFFVPDLAPGFNNLEITLDNHEFSFEYNIIQHENIDDPETYIDETIDGFILSPEEFAEMSESISGLVGSEYNEENIAILNQYENDLEIALNNATYDEKLQLAFFIQANPEIFEDIPDTLRIINRQSPESMIEEMEMGFQVRYEELQRKAVQIRGFNGLGLKFYLGILKTLVSIYKLNHWLITFVDKNVYQDEELLANLERELTFTNGIEYSLDINSNYRKLNATDITSNQSIIASIVHSLDGYENTWFSIMDLLLRPFIGSTPHIKNVTDESTQIFQVSADYLSIANISNSNIILSVRNINGVLQVTFSSSEEENREFTFDLIYNKVGVSTSTTSVSATLQSMLDFTYQTNWEPDNWQTGGIITIEAVGGEQPLSYSIDGGNYFSANNIFTDLSKGYYDLVVKDANNVLIEEQDVFIHGAECMVDILDGHLWTLEEMPEWIADIDWLKISPSRLESGYYGASQASYYWDIAPTFDNTDNYNIRGISGFNGYTYHYTSISLTDSRWEFESILDGSHKVYIRRN